MKISIQTKLLPTEEQKLLLSETTRAFNAACTWLAKEGFSNKIFSKFALQRLAYKFLRERFSLSSQQAVRACARVASCFERDKTVCPEFRETAGVPYDARILSFKRDENGLPFSVSLLTVSGRQILPIVMGAKQRADFTRATKTGETVLVRRKNGTWFLQVSVEIKESFPTPQETFLGVDLGIVNLASDNDGEKHSGTAADACREKNAALRASLQRKKEEMRQKGQRPKNVCRKLKNLSGREARFKKNENHRISKELVQKAKDTGRGIALEDLSGIWDRVGKRFGKAQRARFGSWAFGQLRSFIVYKAIMNGVEVRVVDPHNTSRGMFRMPPHRQEEPENTSSIFLSKVRTRRTCRYQCFKNNFF
jgi:IS605 OrfB family transposase